MSSWKAATFCALVALPLPLSIAASIYLQRPVLGLGSVTIATIRCALYFLILKYITLPYFLYCPYRHLPVPPDDSFILGHVLQLLERPNGHYITKIVETVPNDGLIAMRGLFHMGVVVVPTTIEGYMEVLNSKCYDYVKPVRASELLTRVIGHGLVLAEQAEHKMQRKIVAPAFTGKQIRDLAPVFWFKAKELAKVLSDTLSIDESKPSKQRVGVVNIGKWASRVTLDVIGVACVGRDFGTVHNSNDELGKTYEALFGDNLTAFFALNMVLPSSVVQWLPLKTNKKIDVSVAALRRHCHALIEERRRLIANEEKIDTDILSSLIRSNDLTNDQLVDQLLTFLAAGHDTTATALTWCTYLLCKHPDVQRKLRDEVQKTITLGMDVNADIMESMPYLHGVCMETLRLYPTVPSTGRHAIRDTSICGHDIMEGTEVDISMWAMNRLKDLWGPDAEEYKPERWIGETNAVTGGVNRTDFMTFLHGPRSCIGQGFARLELKCLLSALILNFDIKMQDPSKVPKPVGAVTIKPEGGLELRLTAL